MSRRVRRDLRPLVVLVLVPVLSVGPAFAQCSGFPAGGILNGTINTYYPAPDTVANVTAAAGATCIRVDNAARQGSATTIATGDLLLVIQVQGGTITSSNTECYGDNTDEGAAGCANLLTSGDGSGTTARTAGTYEYVVATGAVVTGAASACGSGVAGDFVNIAGGGAGDGLIGTYTNARLVSGTSGQQTYQVVRVPQYQTAQVGNSAGTATVTASAWNGRSGGIVAFDVAGALTVQTNSGATPPPAIDASGFGFRGGVAVTLGGTSGTAFDRDYRRTSGTSVHANKAEGLAGTPSTLSGLTTGGAQGYPNGDRARGGPGNAGGGGSDGNVGSNDENTGGGGGGNGGKGGRGGNAWRSTDTAGGFGGALYTASAIQLILGGGGGGGTNNNNATKSGGAAGGGMIFVRANNLTGTATFNANGNAAPDLEASAGATNDSGGGGGAGGSIVVLSSSALPTTLSLNANGGFGANANVGPLCSGSAHGPGGGGAGGVILTSDTNPATRSVTGALPGLTNSVGSGGGAGTCDCLAPAATKVPAGNCIQYGATAGTVGQTLTTTLNSLPGVRTCVTASRATLAGLRVDPEGGISFATASERDTLAFRLYESDAAGRGLVPLTPAPLPARGRMALGPHAYRAETRPLERPFVVVEEIETSGHRRRLGPFAAFDPALEAGFAVAEEAASRQESAQRRRLDIAFAAASAPAGVRGARARVAPLPGPKGAVATAVKVTTRGRGPVVVDVADLVGLGVPARLVSPAAIRVFNLGREVPVEMLKDPDGRLVGLRFGAEPLATDYTGDNAYILTFGTRPPAPSVALTRSGFAREPGGVRIEQDAFYIPWVPLVADPWQWGVVFQDVAPFDFAFDLPGLVAGGEDVGVRVGLVGATDNEHVVAATLNGQPLGEVRFSGKVPAEIRALVPAGSLAAAGNTLSLEYDSDDASGFALLDNVDLAVSAQIDPPATVLRVEAYDPRPPSLVGADYLIIGPSDFAEAAERLARAKKSEGHRARAVLVERAFDRYSGGVFEARAIAALIRDARRQSPGLRYVLLLGDDTFDPRGHLGLGEVSRVPSLVGFDGQFGRVPSETAYADTDGDGSPDVAIGRLPAATVEEAERLVEKVERQKDLLRPGKGRHVLAVDNEGPEDATFRAMADDVANGLPAGSTRVFADVALGLPEARATLLQSMRDGVAVVHYFGHGSNAFWADEHLLDTSSALDLAGAGRASLALSWTCEADWYQYHLGPSLGETLLQLPDGGTVAAFGPSGITNPRAQSVLYRRLYPLLRARVPVGEAVRRAKAAVAREEPLALPVLAGFNLLGDPALVLP